MAHETADFDGFHSPIGARKEAYPLDHGPFIRSKVLANGDPLSAVDFENVSCVVRRTKHFKNAV